MDSPIFFKSQVEFRVWLEQNHQIASEVLVGFHKTHTRRPTLTWPQSVDEALCFGWIDGVRRSLGDTAYTIRFTPRKPSSKWSAVNLKRMEELIAEGRMTPAGLAIWQQRNAEDAGYTYEGLMVPFGEAEEAELKANEEAWEFFQSQPPFYRRQCSGWIMRAKQTQTKQKRLGKLIQDSAAGRKLEQYTKYSRKKS